MKKKERCIVRASIPWRVFTDGRIASCVSPSATLQRIWMTSSNYISVRLVKNAVDISSTFRLGCIR